MLFRSEVLANTGDGRKDKDTGRVSGRARDMRLVHLDASNHVVRPGDIVTAVVTHAAPHHLVADTIVSVRATTAGDNSAAGLLPNDTAGTPVSLGMPTLKRS